MCSSSSRSRSVRTSGCRGSCRGSPPPAREKGGVVGVGWGWGGGATASGGGASGGGATGGGAGHLHTRRGHRPDAQPRPASARTAELPPRAARPRPPPLTLAHHHLQLPLEQLDLLLVPRNQRRLVHDLVARHRHLDALGPAGGGAQGGGGQRGRQPVRAGRLVCVAWQQRRAGWGWRDQAGAQHRAGQHAGWAREFRRAWLEGRPYTHTGAAMRPAGREAPKGYEPDHNAGLACWQT